MRSLSVSRKVIFRLAEASIKPGDTKRNRIGGGAPGQMQLLLTRQRNRILVVRDIEIGDHTRDALLLLLLELLGCFFLLSEGLRSRLCIILGYRRVGGRLCLGHAC